MAVRAVECLASPSATCTEQTSSTTAADGTTTNIQNACFSDGAKSLEVDTYPSGASPVVTRAIQILRNGVVCSTVQSTTIKSTDTSGTTVQTTTEIINDSTGNLLATDVSVTAQTTGGAVTDTQTITCAGQSPEPFVRTCLYGSVFSCFNGTCM